MVTSFSLATAAVVIAASSVAAYDADATDNVVVYWGQNSYGAANSDTAGWQKNLSTYCDDDTVNVLPLAFLNVFFSTGDLPEINLANSCNNVDNPVINGTALPDCSFMAEDIKTCQDKGKLVTLSLGGATGAATFTDDAQAEAFAETIWNVFMGGESDVRPFGDAVIDGVDLDIEGGSSAGFAAFAKKLKSIATDAGGSAYLSAAPQCVFPDAYLGEVINAVEMDAIYVQFYNNFCGLQNYDNVNAWNYAQWDDWAKNTSPNKDVKIFIGAPASSTAAGSGYVDATTLSNIAVETRDNYTSFGGVMFWDASQAWANGRIDQTVKGALSSNGTSIVTQAAMSPAETFPATATDSRHITDKMAAPTGAAKRHGMFKLRSAHD
ncbi:glycoside hydrolase family 18 protein [Cylindrobasidium torrendii FP15055 ss-10]|uniref:chitinase n=1 Tax=Cylindrobasidium torrendii FP15055 ss-10 TaxID=1314674 RepID=A0A0D7AZY5_9AGAR|nr:glycoside hydrolase family 18 protein [Cylindrobasidium torrendii FP15055 ss-10]